jgi:hypothetical protein
VNNNHENSTDSFGCGIHSSFPCYSSDWTNNNDLPGVEEVIRYESKIIYVDEEGDDELKCGTLLLPCSSLSYSLTHFDSSETKQMKIMCSSFHQEPFSSSLSLSLLSHQLTEKGTINISSSFPSSLDATIMNEGELIIERIKFHSLDESINESPFILSSSGSSLSLSSSSFSFSFLYLPFSLISVSSGSFSCSSVQIAPYSETSFSSSNSLFSIETTGIVSFSSCLFENLSFSSSSDFIHSSVSIPSSFSVGSSNFTSLSCSSDSPLFFLCSSSFPSPTISDTLFHSITCSSSRQGGGMKYSSSSGFNLSLSSSSFHECCCSDEKGRGGGIFLDLSSFYSSSSVILSFLSFSSNFALIGKDMYVIASSFSSLFSSDSPSPFSFALKNEKSRGFSIFGQEKEGNGNIFFN